MAATSIPNYPLSLQRILKTWWPLAASWLLMGTEQPILSAVIARLENPEINLAAYGGVVFPLALIIEAPVIMLLAASTALSKDWHSYQLVRRYMMTAGAVLTMLHILVAFTPLYDVVVAGIIGAPQEIVEPARIGLMIMTPWTWSIAYRRFNQGMLIRFGHSQTVGIGTIVRLVADLSILFIGYSLGSIQGVVVASAGLTFGVMCEAAYVGMVSRAVQEKELINAPAVQPPLTWSAFWAFYIPLAMTSLLTLLANPIGSAAISRMPQAIHSLAVWQVLIGLVFMFRSLGIAYNEVVVALLDEPEAYANLRKFAAILAMATTVGLFFLAATPLSNFWFEHVAALSPNLASLAKNGAWLALPLPALNVLQSWYQGAILHGRKTRAITESVVIYLFTSAITLALGVAWGRVTGLFVGLLALTLSMIAQTIWLGFRSRPIMVSLRSETQ